MLTPFDTLELLVSKHEELEAAKAMLEQVSIVLFYCICCCLLLYLLFSSSVSIVLFYCIYCSLLLAKAMLEQVSGELAAGGCCFIFYCWDVQVCTQE